MTPTDDYPRMMFRRGHEPVIVQNEEEENALGASWSRRVTFDDPDEAEEETEDGDEEAPDSEDEPAELPASNDAAPARKRAPRAAAGRRKRG